MLLTLRRLMFALVCLTCATLAMAQEAVVTRNVNLRPDASTVGESKRLLTPPEALTLLEPEKDEGYYHVRTTAGEEGYVWGLNVRVAGELPDTPDTGIVPSPNLLAMAAAAALPDAPDCDIPDSTKSRWGQKTRASPSQTTAQSLTVNQMIAWPERRRENL